MKSTVGSFTGVALRSILAAGGLMRLAIAIALLLWAPAVEASTDFGVRLPGNLPRAAAVRSAVSSQEIVRTAASLTGAAAAAAAWGRITSQRRSAEHNRRVGGVHNSFHLSGRAIDLARRPGVRHAEVEGALRRAGYRLVESLDEGDHSHFAFAFGPAPTILFTPATSPGPASTIEWRVVGSRR